MRDVQISEDALEDLNHGYLFYEAQEAGLGEYFAGCLLADIEGVRTLRLLRSHLSFMVCLQGSESTLRSISCRLQSNEQGRLGPGLPLLGAPEAILLAK
jgi:hypothetical protein